MRLAAWLFVLSVLPGCESPACAPPDAGPDVELLPCRSRVVLGPVELGGSGGAGTAPVCSLSAAELELVYSFRVRLRRGAEERIVDARCDEGTDYLDLGYLEPGTYDLGIETADRTRVVAGASLFGPCNPDLVPPGHCAPIRIEVAECDLDVIPVWLYCGSEGCGVPR